MKGWLKGGLIGGLIGSLLIAVPSIMFHVFILILESIESSNMELPTYVMAPIILLSLFFMVIHILISILVFLIFVIFNICGVNMDSFVNIIGPSPFGLGYLSFLGILVGIIIYFVVGILVGALIGFIIGKLRSKK